MPQAQSSFSGKTIGRSLQAVKASDLAAMGVRAELSGGNDVLAEETEKS